jgi:23S rRNA pseudouridine1911/1915/1917 synthase
MAGEVDEPDDWDAGGIVTGLPIRRHALHAARLAFAHPVSQLWLEFAAPLPEDFAATVSLLRHRKTDAKPQTLEEAQRVEPVG